MAGKLRKRQVEVIADLAITMLTALSIYAAVYTIRLQKRQVGEMQEYASLLMRMQSEDVTFTTDLASNRVNGTHNTDSAAVYRAVINTSTGDILWRNTAKATLNPSNPAKLYSGDYLDEIATCKTIFVVITENGKLYMFCGLHKPYGDGLINGTGELGSNITTPNTLVNVDYLMSTNSLRPITYAGILKDLNSYMSNPCLDYPLTLKPITCLWDTYSSQATPTQYPRVIGTYTQTRGAFHTCWATSSDPEQRTSPT